jgi:hypothetical protein
MPFGQHKGLPLSAIPTDYLRWLQTLPDLRYLLRDAVVAELHRRLHAEPHRRTRRRPAGAPPRPRARYAPSFSDVEALVSAGRQTLAKRYHPDLGGDASRMIAVNNAADWLIDEARRLTA